MAKLSSINKNERRKKLVKKYAGKYARLKAIADDGALLGMDDITVTVTGSTAP